jgi:cell division protein ZipA
MMIVGVLLIVAVLLDGYRRVRNERRSRIRVSLSKQVYQQHSYDDDDVEDEDARVISSELPNGGARVVARRRGDLQLDESVPLLMESVGHVEPPAAPPQERAPRAVARAEPELDVADEPLWHAQEPSFHDDPLIPGEEPPVRVARRREPQPEPEPVRAAPAQQQTSWLEEDAPPAKKRGEAQPRKRGDSAPAEPVEPACEPNPTPQEVLIINVLSKEEGGFKGPDLLQIMLACDLRFGKMNIFHRYEKANGRGQVQFSVANVVEPGTFTLDAIDTFSTPGVTFFLALPGPEEPIRAFDYMVETAQVLVKNLHAELRDEAHSAITTQTLEHCRQRIRDFERRQLTLHV